MKKFEYQIVYLIQDLEVEDFGIVLGESYSDALKNLENNFYSVKDNIIEIKITEREFENNVISSNGYFSYYKLTTEERKEE